MTNVATLQTVADLSASVTAQGISSLVPAGVVLSFAGATAPTGWLLCNGAPVSQTTYADLYAAIGIAHGNPGGGSFNLPNYAGQFLRGRANGSTNDPDRATRTAAASGGNVGDLVGSLQTQQMPLHNHQMYSFSGGSAGQAVSLSALSNSRSFYYNSAGSALDFPAGFFIQNNHFTANTTSGSTETRPLNAYVNYIIKT